MLAYLSGTSSVAGSAPRGIASGGAANSPRYGYSLPFPASSLTQAISKSAISRLFLSIIITWVLPRRPASGNNKNLAVPPAPRIALIDAAQPLRRASLFGPEAPTVLSPQTASIGTFVKCFAISSAFSGPQLPSMSMMARIFSGRCRTKSRPYAPDCECTITIAGPTLSSNATRAFTVLSDPGSVVSALGTSCEK